MKTLQTILFVAYFCLIMIVLGGTLFSVMFEYPTWFANVPQSLEATRNFYEVSHPGYFFQIFVPLGVLSGVGFAMAGWRLTSARNLVLASLAVLIGGELLTFLYIYPRLDIMFGPDSATQTVEALRNAASEFTNADRIRTVLTFSASAVSVVALFRFFRFRFTET